MSNVKQFKDLHNQVAPLLIGNVWNAQSAKVLENLKFKAIATSSAAAAETLGYNDGEEMSFDEYLFVIRRIAASTALPLSVDLEAGYASDATGVVANIKALVKAGVVGVNIEDTLVANGKRSIRDTDQFVAFLKDIVESLKTAGIEVFLNIRSDVFLLGLEDPAHQAVSRIHAYQSTGIDGLFFPCITRLEDIKTITKATTLPVNVMAMPGLPNFAELQSAGVKRISMGNFLNKKVYQHLENRLSEILTQRSFDSLFT